MTSISFSLPQAALFKFPPATNPGFVPPPPAGPNSATVFDIPDDVYYAWLDPKVPLTIATVYAVTAKLLNIYNKSTGKKPWAISKTRPFHWFVIAHNVFLAVYSAWTFIGMLGAVRRSFVSPFGPEGLAGFVDSVCRINGPAGLSNSVFYNDEAGAFQTYSPHVTLGADGNPSRFDSGRLWNEGLAFYGWIFYLSKFYEVIDTLIILAKGKLSSTLQTYHHAGAMLCMWAGMRYMSTPIWVFCFVNSFIHALMYTYYTVTALNIRVPTPIKRSLTTMQITQFLVGASYAIVHSFVSYTIPVVVANPEKTASAAEAASTVVDSQKVLVFGNATRVDAADATYGQRVVPCVTSNNSTFAIWLNVFYLAPLTYLFVSFFIESYTRRSNAAEKAKNAKPVDNVAMAEKAGWEAAKKMEGEVYGETKEDSSEARTTRSGSKRILRQRA
ncbi:GNS1/SUR4 family-domain-containing protein [Pseudoneurospora amorphoporcata]|uniref:Elongation of fatty acids protein n=1 Tax=Pseudoneurospora amorphoporcata TaxID=241081 RepID=A0AAN6NYB2_9PEZI|nr:GNS1/SUR4 family-domain-containing protein [Pseudoneurospora amorphoporcata]